jgi:hypothetical protein
LRKESGNRKGRSRNRNLARTTRRRRIEEGRQGIVKSREIRE